MISSVLYYGAGALAVYFAFLTFLASIVAVIQEAKIWAPKSVPSLSVLGCLKVFVFNVVWMSLCFIGSVVIVIKWILSLGTSDIARDGNCLIEKWVAKADTLACVGKVQVVGMEHLQIVNGSAPAPIFVANHSSQIDAGVVYWLNQRFKWIAKSSGKDLRVFVVLA